MKLIEFIKRFTKVMRMLIRNPDRFAVLDLVYDDKKGNAEIVKKIRKETEMLLDDDEAYQILMLVEKTRKIKGDIVEVGVYKGGSAKLISEMKGQKNLYLFDTFEGLPEVRKIDNKAFYKGHFKSSFDSVKDSLKDYKNVYIFKGRFPETSGPIKKKSFSFVHLDVDIYESTVNCLKFFYPRMSKGGVILSHDYLSAAGVKKAFDDFFRDKPEAIIEMAGTQCLIVKTEK